MYCVLKSQRRSSISVTYWTESLDVSGGIMAVEQPRKLATTIRQALDSQSNGGSRSIKPGNDNKIILFMRQLVSRQSITWPQHQTTSFGGCFFSGRQPYTMATGACVCFVSKKKKWEGKLVSRWNLCAWFGSLACVTAALSVYVESFAPFFLCFISTLFFFFLFFFIATSLGTCTQ